MRMPLPPIRRGASRVGCVRSPIVESTSRTVGRRPPRRSCASRFACPRSRRCHIRKERTVRLRLSGSVAEKPSTPKKQIFGFRVQTGFDQSATMRKRNFSYIPQHPAGEPHAMHNRDLHNRVFCSEKVYLLRLPVLLDLSRTEGASWAADRTLAFSMRTRMILRSKCDT